MADSIIGSIKDHLSRIERLERHEKSGWRDHINLSRGVLEDFWGDQLNPQWNTAATLTATAAAVQASSPSRVLMTTGGTINSVSTLNEGGFYKWNSAEGFTLVTRAKLSSTASMIGNLCRVARTGTDLVVLGFDSAINATNFYLRSINGGTNITNDMGVAGDTNWHWLAISVSSTYVRGQIDFGTISEITSNIPTVDMEITLTVQNRAAADKQIEIDYIRLIPGENWF